MTSSTQAVFLLGLAICAPSLSSADVYVVASSDLTLSPDDVKNVYIGEKQLAGSTKIVPLDNAAAKPEFLDKVVKLDAGKYDSLWSKKSFRDGINPPASKASDADIIAAVKSGQGVVGYISSAPPPGVKVLEKL